MKMNQVMSKYEEVIEHAYAMSSDDLNDKLLQILTRGVVVVDDCLLLAQDLRRFSLIDDTYFHNRTDCERFKNRIHIKNIASEHDQFYALTQSILFARCLRDVILRMQLDRLVKIIVVCEEKRDFRCTVRFFMARVDEVPWIDEEELDEFVEPILMIDADGRMANR